MLNWYSNGHYGFREELPKIAFASKFSKWPWLNVTLIHTCMHTLRVPFIISIFADFATGKIMNTSKESSHQRVFIFYGAHYRHYILSNACSYIFCIKILCNNYVMYNYLTIYFEHVQLLVSIIVLLWKFFWILE